MNPPDETSAPDSGRDESVLDESTSDETTSDETRSDEAALAEGSADAGTGSASSDAPSQATQNDAPSSDKPLEAMSREELLAYIRGYETALGLRGPGVRGGASVPGAPSKPPTPQLRHMCRPDDAARKFLPPPRGRKRKPAPAPMMFGGMPVHPKSNLAYDAASPRERDILAFTSLSPIEGIGLFSAILMIVVLVGASVIHG